MRVFRNYHTYYNKSTIEDGLAVLSAGNYVGIRALSFHGDWTEESSYLPAVVCKVERANPPRDYGFMKSKHEYGSAWLTLAGGKKFELTGYGNISDIYAYLLTHLDYWPMLDGQDPDTDFSIYNLPNTGNRNLYDQASDFMLVVYDNALEAKEALQIYKKRLTDVKNAREQQKINWEAAKRKEKEAAAAKAYANAKAASEIDDLFKSFK